MFWHSSEANFSIKINSSDFAAALQRMWDVTDSSSDAELAKILGVHITLFTDALEDEIIPLIWLYRLMQFWSVSPKWILTGRGIPYLPGALLGDIHEDEAREAVRQEFLFMLDYAESNDKLTRIILRPNTPPQPLAVFNTRKKYS